VGRRERIARDCHGRWLDTFLMEHRCKEDEPTGYKKL
jgi:acetyltransferase, GNAT family